MNLIYFVDFDFEMGLDKEFLIEVFLILFVYNNIYFFEILLFKIG